MKKSLQIIAAIIGLALVIYVLKTITQPFVNQVEIDAASKHTESVVADALKDAKEKSTDDKSATEILKEDAKNKMEDELKSDKSYDKKLVGAATNFYGYYLINVETRKVHCEKQNAPIGKFVTEFQEKNKALFDISTKILEKDFSKRNMEFNKKTVAEIVGGSMNTLIIQDMEDIKKQFKLNDIEACELFNKRSADFLDFMAYEKQSKLGFDMLSNAKN